MSKDIENLNEDQVSGAVNDSGKVIEKIESKRRIPNIKTQMEKISDVRQEMREWQHRPEHRETLANGDMRLKCKKCGEFATVTKSGKINTTGEILRKLCAVEWTYNTKYKKKSTC